MIFLFGIILLLLSFQLLEYVFNNLEMPLRCSPSRQAYFPFMLFVSIIEMIFTKILSKNLLKIFFFLKKSAFVSFCFPILQCIHKMSIIIYYIYRLFRREATLQIALSICMYVIPPFGCEQIFLRSSFAKYSRTNLVKRDLKNTKVGSILRFKIPRS